MTLKDAKEGQEITLTPKGIIYIKGKHQGMDNKNVNLKSKYTYNTRCYRKSHRNKLENENTICYPINTK